MLNVELRIKTVFASFIEFTKEKHRKVPNGDLPYMFYLTPPTKIVNFQAVPELYSVSNSICSPSFQLRVFNKSSPAFRKISTDTMVRWAVPLLLLLPWAQSQTSPHVDDASQNTVLGPCKRGAGEQCGGVNGNGEVWELDGPEASCCAEGHICNYKTLYYSECVPIFRGESPARTQRELDTESEEAITEVWAAMNNFYLIINAQIVFFMQAGFAMLEVGIISPKNAKSILFKNLLDMCTVALTWWMWGFGLAGNGASGQIVAEGSSFGDFGMGEGVTRGGSGRGGGLDWENSAAFLHSLVFATTTTTIMSGGVAERMKVEVSRGRGE